MSFRYSPEVLTRIHKAAVDGDISGAIALAERFEIENNFPRDEAFGVRRPISHIERALTCRPRILKNIPGDVFSHLRTIAVMAQIVGFGDARKFLPKGLSTGSALEVEAAVRMIYFFLAAEAERGSEFARLATQVRTRLASEEPFPPCDACRELALKVWRPGEEPEVPYEHCTHRLGCRCIYIFDID